MGKEVIITLRRQLQLPLPKFCCGTADIWTYDGLIISIEVQRSYAWGWRVELWEIVLQYPKICCSVKYMFCIRMTSTCFIICLEKRMFSQLCFLFTYLFLSTGSFFLFPSPLTGLTFKILCRLIVFLPMSACWTELMAEDMKGR